MKKIIDFIKKFDGKTIGAISIAPLLLVRAGLLNGKPFMAGINKEEIFEEGFSEGDLAEMVGWDDNLSKPVEEGYIITGNIITSISYNFVKWALAFVCVNTLLATYLSVFLRCLFCFLFYNNAFANALLDAVCTASSAVEKSF